MLAPVHIAKSNIEDMLEMLSHAVNICFFLKSNITTYKINI